MKNAHDFEVDGLGGQTIHLADYAGKHVLVVNVASACGFTPQYQQLQEMYAHFAEKLVVIGFPCNDFGGQEPGSAEEIQQFCQINYGVDFPLTAKIKIRTQPAHPLYQWLESEAKSQGLAGEVQWNFHKFLLSPQGQLVGSYPSSVSPMDDAILAHFS